MLGWYLQEKRLEHLKKKKKDTSSSNTVEQFKIRTPQRKRGFLS